MQEITREELENIEGGCGWCYVGAASIIVGGFCAGGVLGGIVAGVGVADVLLV